MVLLEKTYFKYLILELSIYRTLEWNFLELSILNQANKN